MITKLAGGTTSTALQTFGSGITLNHVLLLGIVAIAVVAVAWLITSSGSSG